MVFYRYLDSLEAVGGAEWLAKKVEYKNDGPWNEPLGALIIGIHQLGLSGWKPEECIAITNELKAWQERPPLQTEGKLSHTQLLILPCFALLKLWQYFEGGTRIWGLRLKATIHRAQRLTEDYSEALFYTFPQKVEVIHPIQF